MRINTNISSLNAQESAVNTSKSLSGSLEKLSSGLRINKASDDASGLAIADKLRTQASSINQGIANGNSAITLLQIADKSMAEQSSILDTVKSKLIQANTDTTSTAGRAAIAKDISKLLEQLNNIGKQTNYNGRQLISGSDGTSNASSHTFQVGEKSTDTINTGKITANTTGLSLATGLSAKVALVTSDLTTVATNFGSSVIKNAQSLVNTAITKLNTMRSDIGSTQNQVESAVRNLMTQATNVKAAESIIRAIK